VSGPNEPIRSLGGWGFDRPGPQVRILSIAIMRSPGFPRPKVEWISMPRSLIETSSDPVERLNRVRQPLVKSPGLIADALSRSYLTALQARRSFCAWEDLPNSRRYWRLNGYGNSALLPEGAD
jgi:hypothetical protein